MSQKMIARVHNSIFGLKSAVMRAVMAISLALLVAGSGGVQAGTMTTEAGARLIPTVAAQSASAGIQSVRPAVPQSLVTPVVGYECRACRRACYRDYRIDCWEGWCRGAFTKCMRACWEEICR